MTNAPPTNPLPTNPLPSRPPDLPPARSEDDPIWQFLERLDRGLQHVEARIDRLYIAVGGGTILLAAIGLAAGFIARGA